jgi:hypothetical protein
LATNKAIEHIYLPNEVFQDLQDAIGNSRQTAFAYSYLYYTTYLYRYCKYIDDNGEKMTQDAIKFYLGYAPKNKKVDYIIKKGGILDNLFYTETTTDYPIQFLYDDNDIIIFETISQYKNNIRINDRNFRIKKPTRAFHRSLRAIEESDLTGTFYEVENTHRIDFKVFERIIAHPDLGVVAFYLYGYLKHKNDIFKSGFQRSYMRIGEDLGMSDRTVYKYVKSLENNGFIFVEHKEFNLHNNDNLEANIYNVV